MKLLISNDDGILALGVRSLANTLVAAGHEVTVVCPDRERSGTGHSLTLDQPIRAERVDDIFHPAIVAWACAGTPCDSVKLGLEVLISEPPDYVIAGINQGANLGTDILYSGTVSAAMEGSLLGIDSIALSLTSFSSADFAPAASFASGMLAILEQQGKKSKMLLNVNVPAVRSSEIAGVAITRQGVRRYDEVFKKRVDPRGKTYYWLAGELLSDSLPDSIESEELPTDVQAISANYISVTPLQYNLTSFGDIECLAFMAALFEADSGGSQGTRGGIAGDSQGETSKGG
ncbi:MAG: 5'/3'-nucleotidase SurE [Hormoscilla sp. GM102CHS1]|nr:5'/3'-nucleotidase SurE [Hormoscilla sp. SP12CHS1]MBC6473062.1 5'/3'-nucleotidase SurE [Hormoscilla sp. GM102CHS1]